MAGTIGAVRSALALLAILAGLGAGAVIQRILIWPLVSFFPHMRSSLMSPFMQAMAVCVLRGLRLAGARVDYPERIPARQPVLIVSNHQSLLDIPVITRMCRPYYLRFVTRRRYFQWRIPLISPLVRLLRCPDVDPDGDARGAIVVLKQAAGELEHALAIFPEGHRSRDGEIQDFRPAGIQVLLRTRPMPVYAVVIDGFWRSRRFTDLVFRIHTLRGRATVLGPFEPPPDAKELPAFVERLRTAMQTRLSTLRSGDEVLDAAS